MLKEQSTTVPPQATFSLVLNRLLKGETFVIKNANCEFSYKWDFPKNMGLAELISINNCLVNIILHPTGIAGKLDFMSDISPTAYVINGQRIIIYRVILDIDLSNDVRSAGIMFNADGSCIEVTENFDSKHFSK